MHDDQHGTAVVILAALINAALRRRQATRGPAGRRVGQRRGRNGDDQDAAGGRRARRRFRWIAPARSIATTATTTRIGAGWPSTAIAKTAAERCADVLARRRRRSSASPRRASCSRSTSRRWRRDPIVFAMANPTPEIMPDVAAPYAAVIATGRSDFPNQVNNLLAFPGIFRGALDVRARRITDRMKLAAALRDRRHRHRRRAQPRIHHSQRLRSARRRRGRQSRGGGGGRGRRRTPELGKERRRGPYRQRLRLRGESKVVR